MTNGEKIKEIFPNAEIGYGLRGVVAVTFIHKTIFDLDWWNAEYKEPTTKNDLGVRKFEEIVVEYPPEELCAYPEYKGKPYFGIKYRENGEEIVGYGTYNPEVLSQFLKDYFISTTKNDIRDNRDKNELNRVKNELEPNTKNNLPQERYQDLIDYFGDKEVAKTILEDRKEFKAWLERLRWSVKRADELARELEQIKGTTKNDLGVDCINRQATINAVKRIHPVDTDYDCTLYDKVDVMYVLDEMPSVTPQNQVFPLCKDCHNKMDEVRRAYDNAMKQKSILNKIRAEIAEEKDCGKWILDKRPFTNKTYYCSLCHSSSLYDYNYCPNCGAKMESEDN